MSRYKITLVYEDDRNNADILTKRAAIGVSSIDGVTLIDSGWALMDEHHRDWMHAGLPPENQGTIQAHIEETKQQQEWFNKGVAYATEALRHQAEIVQAETDAREKRERESRTGAPGPETIPGIGITPKAVAELGLCERMHRAHEAWRRDIEAEDDAREKKEHDAILEEHDAILEELRVGLRCKSVTLTWLAQGENTGHITESPGRDIIAAAEAVRRSMDKLKKLYPNRRFLLKVSLRRRIGRYLTIGDVAADDHGSLA